MRDYISIGSAPHDENCQQLGENYNSLKAQLELRAFRNQILRHYPVPNETVGVRAKSFPHDFGSYSEICVVYDDDQEDDVRYAFDVEGDEKDVLSHWDDEAKQFLKDFGYYDDDSV